MRRRMRATAAGAAVLVVLAGCSTAADEDAGGPVTLEFFQFKSEAIAVFDELIADFEEQHPGIRVRQNAVPDAEAAIRVRLIRDDVPDVMSLNGNHIFGRLAEAGVFHDFSDTELIDQVRPAIVEILRELGAAGEGEVNGVPFANNADGVIYNKQVFADLGLEPPTTWDEMTALVDELEANGVLPFYGTLRDAWTSLPAWNQLAATVPPDDFWDELSSDDASFTEDHDVVAARLAHLYDHTQDSYLERGYDDGNSAFAAGESAMYLQGSWAIPVIRGFEPAFEMGTFPLPTDDPADTRLVSGVDVALTMGRATDHPEQVLTFLEFMLSEDVQRRYAEDQAAVPAREGMEPTQPELEGLQQYIDDGLLVGFADHQVPPAIALDALNQQFLTTGDRDAYLSTLDERWDRVALRSS